MAAHDGEKTGFDKWADGLKNAVTDSKWSMYDCEVKNAVSEFNRHLKGTAGYRLLDWRLIKAMLWVETGAGHAQWRTNPIQIGVAGAPGLQAFLADDGAGPMILPANWSGKIRVATARINPSHGIRAGVGYLLMRAARFEHQSVYHSDSKIYQVTVTAATALPGSPSSRGQRSKSSTS